MKLQLRKRVIEFLSTHPEQKFKASEIAEWIRETYPEEVAAKLEASASLETTKDLQYQLVAEIGAQRLTWQKKHPELRTTDGVRPRLYYWTLKSEEAEVEEAEQEDKALLPHRSEGSISEHDLYPELIEYLRIEHDVRAHRIDERKSSNSRGTGGNRWLFPDVVGMEDLTLNMNQEVVAAIRESRDKRTRLWSFEVKKLINGSNVRETYFQAVSNSSWANFGYLVAAEIDGARTLEEMRILYAMHGIGLMRLDAGNPAESQILIPARERSDLEWAMCSRLATENKDFLAFIRKVRQFFQTGDL